MDTSDRIGGTCGRVAAPEYKTSQEVGFEAYLCYLCFVPSVL